MRKLILGAALVASMVACKTEKKEAVKTTDVKTENSTAKTNPVQEGEISSINLTDSYVWYKGSKILGESHDGKIPFKNGSFKVQDGKLIGGKFALDLENFGNDDLDGKSKNDFIGHMKAPDFLNVAEFPTANFKILSVDGENVTGVLTIKNVSKNITIPATYSVNGNKVNFESAFNIDRTDFDMNFNKEGAVGVAKDRIIKNIIELKVKAMS